MNNDWCPENDLGWQQEKAYILEDQKDKAYHNLREEHQRLLDALDPNETKNAYSGEFKFYPHVNSRTKVTVPWTTVKEIMKAIKKRAGVE